MADQRNYAALDWVLGEIEETLNEARQALEAYVENPKDATQLRFCITHVHQVRGSLQIVEFHGASLLAEEMELLAQALMNQKVTSVSETQEVLMRSLLQLPIYLDHVKVYRDDTVRTILPLLNDIRALRKESYLSETNLFNPDLSPLSLIVGQRHPALQDDEKLKQVTNKLREMYQFAAASVLRNIKVRENLDYLEKVFARLVVLTSGTPSAPLWRISSALIDGLKDEGIELSIAVKGLLRYLARELRLLSEKAPLSFERPVPEALAKNLLYYIATSDSGSALVKQIKDEFNLKQSEDGASEENVDGYNVSALDPDAVRSVVTALREELKSIKSNLDTALTSQTPPGELTEILPVVKRVADTLAVLGIRELRETMLMQAEFLSDLSKRNSLDESGLVESAGHIIDVDSKLEAISKAVDRHRDIANINERAIEIDEAKLAVLKECQIGLEKVKEAIIEYISSQWDVEQLSSIDHLLNDIRGGLDMVPLPRAGAIIGLCSRYIVEQLIKKGQEPSWTSLDALADTMASIEYFLERLSNDMSEDAESLLDLAEKSIASLGYPLKGEIKPDTVDFVASESHDAVQESEVPKTGVADVEAQASQISELQASDATLSGDASEEVVVEEPSSESSIASANIDDVSVAAAHAPKLESVFEEDEPEIDDEIIEIFIEEAQEVFETLAEHLPPWLDRQDQDALSVVRRAYHTLKGSGRMVEAMDIGEFAWSIENMLNRVIDQSVAYQSEHGQLVQAVTDMMPAMVDAFKHRQAVPEKVRVDQYTRWAFSLAEGTVPDDFDVSVSSDIAESESHASVEQVQNDDLADDGIDEDYTLLEIFSSEVETHLSTIREFIALMDAEAPIYSVPSDELQRALHTLKGSAKMAQVVPIAQMYEVLESFAKEMVTFQVTITEDVLQLIRDAVSYTEGVLEQIKARAPVSIARLEQFLARNAELRELNVGHLVRMKEQQKDGETPVDPRLLSIFMAEEMTLLLDADDIVEQWFNSEADTQVLSDLSQELETLATGAEQAKLPDMASLALLLKAIDTHYLTHSHTLDELGRDYLLRGHAALLDMVDAVAAGQIVQAPAPDLIADMQRFIEGLSSVDEAPLADSDEVVVEPVLGEPATEKASPEEATPEEAAPEASLEAVPAIDFTPALPVESENEIAPAQDQDGAELEYENSAMDDAASIEGSAELSGEEASAEGSPVQEYEEHEEHRVEEAVLEPPIFEQDISKTESNGSGETSVEHDYSGEPSEGPVAEAAPSETEEAAASAPGLLDIIDTEAEDFDFDILEVFLEECDELFEELDEAIHGWETDEDISALEEMKRALHTMKGGARLSGLPVLGDLVHDYESFLIATDVSAADEVTFASVHAYQDKIFKGVNAVKQFLGSGGTVATPDANIDDIQVDSSHSGNEASGEAGADEGVLASTASDDEKAGQADQGGANVLPFVSKPRQDAVMPLAGAGGTTDAIQETAVAGSAAAVAKKTGPQEVVRINSDLLEELVNLAGETSISRSRLEEQVTEFRNSLDEIDSTIDRLQEQLRRLDIETEAQVLFRQEQMAVHEENFDPLEMDRYSHLQQLSRSLMESASDLYDLRSDLSDKVKDAETTLLQQSRINTTLQEGLMRSRMVPFSRLVPRLRRIVRQVASELGKKVSFELDNVEGELDRNVLERMVPPFEHMLRNAVDHGIESPEDRVASGKPETGRIVLTLGREGGNVIIRLADDGRGVDLQRVRNKAIERGLMDVNAHLSDHDVMQFILHAGFSTAESVTQISGRGVGMDVVNAEIKQLGGDVTINSSWGQGTEFVIHLPFTLSVNRALMVEIGKEQFAIPLNTIEGIVRVSPFELDHYYNHPDTEFEYANEKFKVRYLGGLLYAGRKPVLEGHVLPLPVVLVRSAQHTMALQVDSLMGSREIVVKSLGSQFSTVQGLSGATIMGDGSVVVILDPHALVRQEIAKSDLLIGATNKAQLGIGDDSAAHAQEDLVRTVMVVDDSVTVRKVTTRFLEREGFNVITAKDGVDALQVLQDESPDVMLLDIEMPRMDGFEVAKNLRTSQRWKSLPIIMITSRTGDKHRQHALSLGVNQYMGKPYQEDALLESIQALVSQKAKH